MQISVLKVNVNEVFLDQDDEIAIGFYLSKLSVLHYASLSFATSVEFIFSTCI